MRTRPQVIAATNRIDILDPALLRSGRLDRKIEFPLPNEMARARILEIHSRKMSVAKDVNFDELARSTDEFNGAQLKAVCVEAGMIALREGATSLNHEHFLSGIGEGESSSLDFVGRASRWLIDFLGHSAEQEEERPDVLRVDNEGLLQCILVVPLAIRFSPCTSEKEHDHATSARDHVPHPLPHVSSLPARSIDHFISRASMLVTLSTHILFQVPHT